MARYLIQDHRFLDSFLTLLGAALASADTFEARLASVASIGMVSGEEKHLFSPRVRGPRRHRGQAHDRSRYAADRRLQRAIMREAAETRSYAAALSVLVVAEWLYLDWPPARRSRCRSISCTPSGSRCTTIRGFAASVDFLRAELDRIDGDRMNRALIQHAQNDIDDDKRRRDEHLRA